jgi:tRNA pseudouridine38-40 synthase
MARYKLLLEYDGTRYGGWQLQRNARTIQGELLAAARASFGNEGIELVGAGRTDAGVHALGQVAHLDLPETRPPAEMVRALNDALPPDITVRHIDAVPPRFHARYHAVSRSYLYQVARRKTAFGKRYVWWVRDPLDLPRMRAVAARMTGRHDFRSFVDKRLEDKSTQIELSGFELREVDDLILFRVSGAHFLWKLVRRLVGVVVAVGAGHLGYEQVEAFFAGHSSEPARWTAPPSGLFLETVGYAGDPPPGELRPVVRLDGSR